jgi:hypothetical protein
MCWMSGFCGTTTRASCVTLGRRRPAPWTCLLLLCVLARARPTPGERADALAQFSLLSFDVVSIVLLLEVRSLFVDMIRRVRLHWGFLQLTLSAQRACVHINVSDSFRSLSACICAEFARLLRKCCVLWRIPAPSAKTQWSLASFFSVGTFSIAIACSRGSSAP